MAEPKWLKGQTLSLEIDDIEVNCDISAAKIAPEEADDDFTTFCSAAQNKTAYDYHLTFTAGQSLDADSLWTYVFDHEGEEVNYVLAPAGNAVASIAQPHFTGTVKIGQMPDLGGEASRTGAVWTWEADWLCNGKPKKKTA